MLKEQLQQDLKAAMLAGDKPKAEVLRGLKSAILYEEVAKGVKDIGLDDAAILNVLGREAKKRAESIELYRGAGETERADKEAAEKAIIERYLPAQLSDEALNAAIDKAMTELGAGAQMGQIIGKVRGLVGQQADGGRIAAAVKAKL
ncbi:MAG TPA: GatB/YqeY domain-containing protein [Candidatus Acidoferrum sp.]|nr:GatB/YqeY domain-containing protein [Candidatus Acidoferrum sp.]